MARPAGGREREFGDFQTPPALVAAVLARLGASWSRVVEPTVGRGAFLDGVLRQTPAPREVIGFEVQEGHLTEARAVAGRAGGGTRVELTRANLFDIDLRRALRWQGGGPLLVVGNPPWVTNAALGALGSENLPPKSNVKGLRGIDARTGSSNFDAAEAVWLKLLDELAGEPATIALLCKTLVARNVLEHARARGLPVSSAWVARIDAARWFGASVDAGLLCLTLGAAPTGLDRVAVFDDLEATTPARWLGFARGRLVFDGDGYAAASWADGTCPLVWRQGVKHDAAALMELAPDPHDPGSWRNGRGEPVAVEDRHVFPLLKGADLARGGPPRVGRAVVLTQRRVGEPTDGLEGSSPALWAYLDGHRAVFSARRSSIYRGRPAFCLFGIGPYTFAPFKVAVSGLHPRPAFHAVGPSDGRPVVFDDTCYFLPARSAEQAALAAALLNGPEALALLAALTFPGSKRPVTKSLLQRLDLNALLGRADRPALLGLAGATVERLEGRPPSWPDPLDALLRPDDPDPSDDRTHRRESPDSWPSPPSTISAGR